MKLNKYTRAAISLLVYCVKYEWVIEKALMNDIDLNFGLSNKCSEEEIDDYIDILKEDKVSKKNILYKKFKATNNREEKLNIAQQLYEEVTNDYSS